MNEQSVKELLEGIKRELELQNDLKMYDMLHGKTGNDYRYVKMDINDMTRGRLYARLSDEDRSILERYSKTIFKNDDDRKLYIVKGKNDDEMELYNVTVGGFPGQYNESEIQAFISKIFVSMRDGFCTEKELYEYFERVCERSEMLVKLDCVWENEWQKYKKEVIDEKFEDNFECCLGILNEEEWEKRRQEKMEEYENRITKAYAEEQKEYE